MRNNAWCIFGHKKLGFRISKEWWWYALCYHVFNIIISANIPYNRVIGNKTNRKIEDQICIINLKFFRTYKISFRFLKTYAIRFPCRFRFFKVANVAPDTSVTKKCSKLSSETNFWKNRIGERNRARVCVRACDFPRGMHNKENRNTR